MSRDLTQCAALFVPADPPRQGRIAFWAPDSRPLPAGPGTPGELALAVRQDDGTVAVQDRPVRWLPVAEATGWLARARYDDDAHPAASYWGAVTLAGWELVAGGRLLPAVTAEGYDAWRAGPLDGASIERIAELAAAMPAEARARPTGPGELPDPAGLVRGYLDAIADGLPRTPAAAAGAGGPVFAAGPAQRVPGLRAWAEELAAGLDSGVRLSLRVDLVGPDRGRHADHEGPIAEFVAVLQVHGGTDPGVVREAAAVWAEGVAQLRADVLLGVRRAARAWGPVGRLLDEAVPAELVLSDDEVSGLLTEGAVRLAGAGVDVHWPRELAGRLGSRAVVRAGASEPADLPTFFGGDSLLDFVWQLTLDGQALTDAELDALAQAHRPVVRLRDQWVLVDPELARRAQERVLKPLTPIDALGAALTGRTEVEGRAVEVVPTGFLEALRDRITGPAEELTGPPDGLAATLRDYQLDGLRWLVRMTGLGLGACLADDMGLGKTITLIALHLHRGSGPTLVVCPASLLGNWEREITRFAPGTPVRRFHGAGRSLRGATDGFVLTTYQTMRMDIARLREHRWDLVVADEAQHVKNPRSGTAKALRRIGAPARVALTGTPVENNLTELWSILDWTTPGLLGGLGAFRSAWAVPIEVDRDPAVAERLARLVRPFLLRRKKSDPGVAPELPPKTETDQPVALTEEQTGLYQAVVTETMAQIRASSGMERRGLVMKLLTSLKQICNHPAQYLHEPDGRLPARSGKLELLDELLGTIVAEDGAVLVFTQYVAMARLLERHLARRGIGAQLLHGGTPVPRREEQVARFQAGEVPVFLLSLKAAGTGLNLTRADHVVHYDRWWNPAVEDQATDRAYRIGQTRPVQVHRLIAEGTVEDRIAAMLASKRELADAVLAGGEAALTELSDAELAELIELRGAPMMIR